jgi:hypothetical protein
MGKALTSQWEMLGSILAWNAGYPDKGFFVAILNPGFGLDQPLLYPV